MIATLPASLAADENAAAILHGNGGVLLNGSPAPATAALFPRDAVETQPKAVARIELTGSSIDIDAETVVEYESDEIVLDHGHVSVNTSRAFKVRAGCVTVTPVNQTWTRYDVTDTDGKVIVAALKNDVNIDSRSANTERARQSPNSGRVLVREGEQKSREEKCGAAILKSSPAAAHGGFLNSPYGIGTAAGVGAGITLCILLCKNDDPISPSIPKP